MKLRTFYHLSLAIPYLVLIFSGGITLLMNGFDPFMRSPDPALGIVAGVMVFFTFSAIVWGPLYTWMVAVMLIWSRNRRTEDVRRLYLLSPVLLGCSMGIPALAVDPASSGRLLAEGFLRMNNIGFAIPLLFGDSSEESLYIGMAWLFMAAICMVVGYLFVGIVLLVERWLLAGGVLKEDASTPDKQAGI